MQCYTAAISGVEQNLRTIMQRVHELTAGHLSLVVLPDYWSVWLGGQHAQAQGQMNVDVATVTDDVNTAIKTVAAETGSAYVDLRAAFKGPDYSYDETHYLASDGDHPNAAGRSSNASERAIHGSMEQSRPPQSIGEAQTITVGRYRMSTDQVAPAEAVRNDTLRDLTSDRLRDTESGDDACYRAMPAESAHCGQGRAAIG